MSVSPSLMIHLGVFYAKIEIQEPHTEDINDDDINEIESSQGKE